MRLPGDDILAAGQLLPDTPGLGYARFMDCRAMFRA